MQINTKSKAFQITINILLAIAGVVLLYVAFNKQDLNEIWQTIKNSNLVIIYPVLAASLTGLVFRALRWQLLVQPLGKKVGIGNAFASLMIGYSVNYAVPRVGEITRSVILGNREKLPPTSLFGTVMAERLADLVMLGLVITATFIFNYTSIQVFFTDNIFGPVVELVHEKLFKNEKMTAITLVVLGLIVYAIYSFFKKADAKSAESYTNLDKMVDETWTGLATFTKINNYLLFLIYTLIIWIANFLTSYLWLLSFVETENFPMAAGFTIYTISTIARSVPIQGGAMGAYHYLVTQGLLLFGVNATVGNAYAILNHGSQMILQLSLGAMCGLALMLLKPLDKHSQPIES